MLEGHEYHRMEPELYSVGSGECVKGLEHKCHGQISFMTLTLPAL